jgi:Ca2+-binding RTX toxin-like protein
VIFPGRGNDWVDAGPDGTLYSEEEIGDTVYASKGDDVLRGGGGLGSGRGLDELNYALAKRQVRVDLAAHLARIGAQHDTIRGFEIVHGSDHDDVILGTDRFEELSGGDGNDIITGRGGIDFVEGGRGDDRLSGGLGDDALSGGPNHDIAHAGAGDDYCNTVEQYAGCEHMTQ